MEMTAMLMGLRAIKKPMQHVTVFTDSAYVMNAWTQGWLKKWKKNGWRAGPRGSKGPVANRDLWEALVLAADSHMLHFTKVKGHDEDGKFPLNDRVDELSREARLNPEMFVEVELPLIENLALELA
jgi:ribonuclease HI